MLFKNISIIDENFECQNNMFLATKDNIIAYIGKEKPSEDFGREYDGTGKVIIPGLYNSHAHAPMSILRGYAENLPLSEWLNNRIFPFEAKMVGEDIYNGALLSFAEGLKFGTVSSTEMYYWGEYLGRAVEESGIKCNISLSVLCFDNSSLYDLPIYKENETIIPKLHKSSNGRLKVDLSLHAEYTSTPKVVSEMAQYAKQKALNMHIHLSETKAEVEGCKQRHNGQTPAEYFNSLGIFDVPTTAAHCVWLQKNDFDILKEKGVTAVNCPISNLKLASGFCNVKKLLDNGVNIALGTDSAASNNNLNLFEELKLFATLYKATNYDATAITPQQALRCATLNGAISQGRENCGKIKVGNCADIVVINTDSPNMQPIHNMLNNIVYSLSSDDILLTMVDGEVLYENGEYTKLDIEKIIFNANESTKKILKQL
ncbi:MAG: amidohydrolase [Clostridiales bacterium]|nr:amidohydrolase [Clostridiales bacterium]